MVFVRARARARVRVRRTLCSDRYGAIKARDGLMRVARDNLLVFPELMPFTDTTNTNMAMAFQASPGPPPRACCHSATARCCRC